MVQRIVSRNNDNSQDDDQFWNKKNQDDDESQFWNKKNRHESQIWNKKNWDDDDDCQISNNKSEQTTAFKKPRENTSRPKIERNHAIAWSEDDEKTRIELGIELSEMCQKKRYNEKISFLDQKEIMEIREERRRASSFSRQNFTKDENPFKPLVRSYWGNHRSELLRNKTTFN